MGPKKVEVEKTAPPPDAAVVYGMTALAVVTTIWLCGSTLHLLAPDDFSGAFLLRSTPVSTMMILKDRFIDASMAARSSAYTEICQDNAGPGGFDKNLDAPRGPFPPFNKDTALQKVKKAEAAWNSRDPELVAMAYSSDALWRNRDELFIGREEIKAFLTRKWAMETNYRLVKNLWSWHDNRIAVRFTYEYQHAETGQWYRCHGNELWQFDNKGYMQHRDMSGNDIAIEESDRLYRWETEAEKKAAEAAEQAAKTAAEEAALAAEEKKQAEEEEKKRAEEEEMRRVEAELKRAEEEAAAEQEAQEKARATAEAEVAAAEAQRAAAEAAAKDKEEHEQKERAAAAEDE